jgi:disulfide bond formation protein DsbB
MKGNLIYTLLAAAVLFLVVVPLGTSVFLFGFIHGDSPCILCWAQRLGMALVALIGLFILRYGPRPRYVGLGVLVSSYGVFMAIRHSSLHLARDIGQGFAIEMLGAHTYVWSFVVFWVCLVVMALMLLAVPAEDMQPQPPRRLRGMGRVALVGFVIVIGGTIVQAFASTGPPPYVGQADPVRFSFNPRYWVWSLDEYSAAPISMRGRWAIEKPDQATVDPAPASVPWTTLPTLAVVERRTLDLGLRGAPAGLAYDAGTDRFLLVTDDGIYLTDGALRQVVRHTVVDPLFAVDLGRFSGAAFLDDGQVVAVSENKSYVILRESESADAVRNFRYFLESPTAFDEVSRSRFSTIRARMMYVMSAAVDRATRSIVTITVPSSRNRRWVISRFDLADMTLSEEFVPRVDPTAGLSVEGGGDPLEELYVTAATIEDGRLYALSAARSTLLTIDLSSRSVAAAHTIPGLARPTGLAVKDGRFHIVSADGSVTIVGRSGALGPGHP